MRFVVALYSIESMSGSLVGSWAIILPPWLRVIVLVTNCDSSASTSRVLRAADARRYEGSGMEITLLRLVRHLCLKERNEISTWNMGTGLRLVHLP